MLRNIDQQLCSAISGADLNKVKLALDNGANANLVIPGAKPPGTLQTALHMVVCFTSSPEILTLMLQRGANPTIKSGFGMTLLEALHRSKLSCYSSELTTPPRLLMMKRILTVGWQQAEREEKAKQEAIREVERRVALEKQQEATRLAAAQASARQAAIAREQEIVRQREVARQAAVQETARQAAAEEAAKQALIEETARQAAAEEARQQEIERQQQEVAKAQLKQQETACQTDLLAEKNRTKQEEAEDGVRVARRKKNNKKSCTKKNKKFKPRIPAYNNFHSAFSKSRRLSSRSHMRRHFASMRSHFASRSRRTMTGHTTGMSYSEYSRWVYAQQCAREQGRSYQARPNSGGQFGFAKSNKQLQAEAIANMSSRKNMRFATGNIALSGFKFASGFRNPFNLSNSTFYRDKAMASFHYNPRDCQMAEYNQSIKDLRRGHKDYQQKEEQKNHREMNRNAGIKKTRSWKDTNEGENIQQSSSNFKSHTLFSISGKTTGKKYSARLIEDKHGNNLWMRTSRDIDRNVDERNSGNTTKRDTGITRSPLKAAKEDNKLFGKFNLPKFSLPLVVEKNEIVKKVTFSDIDFISASGVSASSQLSQKGIMLSANIYTYGNMNTTLINQNYLVTGSLGFNFHLGGNLNLTSQHKNGPALNLKAGITLFEGKLAVEIPSFLMGQLNCKPAIELSLGVGDIGIDINLSNELTKQEKYVKIFDINQPSLFKFKYDLHSRCHYSNEPSMSIDTIDILKNGYEEVKNKVYQLF